MQLSPWKKGGILRIDIACVAFSFGGTITVYPSLVSDFFGLNNLAENYGGVYLGFVIGSVMGSLVASLFSGFTVTFSLFRVVLMISLSLSVAVRHCPLPINIGVKGKRKSPDYPLKINVPVPVAAAGVSTFLAGVNVDGTAAQEDLQPQPVRQTDRRIAGTAPTPPRCDPLLTW